MFSVFFFIALIDYYKNVPLFEIGLSSSTTNIILLGFSFLGIAKTLYHIFSF